MSIAVALHVVGKQMMLTCMQCRYVFSILSEYTFSYTFTLDSVNAFFCIVGNRYHEKWISLGHTHVKRSVLSAFTCHLAVHLCTDVGSKSFNLCSHHSNIAGESTAVALHSSENRWCWSACNMSDMSSAYSIYLFVHFHCNQIMWIHFSVHFGWYHLTFICQHLHLIVRTCWLLMVHGCSHRQHTHVYVHQVWGVRWCHTELPAFVLEHLMHMYFSGQHL